MPLLRTSSPSHTAVAFGKGMPSKRVIRTLMTFHWHLIAKHFDEQGTPILNRRSNCTQQEKKSGCERENTKASSLYLLTELRSNSFDGTEFTVVST